MSSRRFLPGRMSSALMGAVLTALGGLSAPAPVPATLSVMALVAVGSSFVSAPASAATAVTSGIVELSPTPPNVTQAVPPNIVVTFDDSGSMASNYMGDNRPFDGGSWSGPWRCAGVIDPRITSSSDVRSKAMNGVYYNPNVVYSPPVKANGSLFPNADKTLAAVWLDGVGVNRPYSPVTADTYSSYRNNPNGTTDPTGLTDLTGTINYKTNTIIFVKFGDSTACPANADAGSCQVTNSATSSGGVSSIEVFTSSIIVFTGCEMASRNSTELTSTDFGKPVSRSLWQLADGRQQR